MASVDTEQDFARAGIAATQACAFDPLPIVEVCTFIAL